MIKGHCLKVSCSLVHKGTLLYFSVMDKEKDMVATFCLHLIGLDKVGKKATFNHITLLIKHGSQDACSQDGSEEGASVDLFSFNPGCCIWFCIILKEKTRCLTYFQADVVLSELYYTPILQT